MTAPAPRRGRTVVVVAAVVVAVGIVAAVIGFVVLRTGTFSVTTVVVTGERHESAAQVVNVAGLRAAPPIATVDTSAVALRLERHFPWIASAAVTTRWPHTVTIAVTERIPVALVAGPRGATDLVDVSGRRLGSPGHGQVLPTLSYAPARGTVLAATGPLPAAAAPGLMVAATLPPAFAYQVAAISVDARGWVTLHLATPVTFLLGPTTDLGAKYEDVAAVIARTTLHAGDVVDVSVPQSITVTGP